MITAENLLDCLGKPAPDPCVRGMLAELGLPSEPPEIEDEVSTDLLATDHGVAVFFMTAHHLRNQPQVAGQPTNTAVLSQVMFSAKGLNGGPGFAGELPYGLTFSDSRAAVRERLGEPSWTSPLGIPNDSWTFGERYLTLDFSKDESRIKKLTCGVSWVL